MASAGPRPLSFQARQLEVGGQLRKEEMRLADIDIDADDRYVGRRSGRYVLCVGQRLARLRWAKTNPDMLVSIKKEHRTCISTRTTSKEEIILRPNNRASATLDSTLLILAKSFRKQFLALHSVRAQPRRGRREAWRSTPAATLFREPCGDTSHLQSGKVNGLSMGAGWDADGTWMNVENLFRHIFPGWARNACSLLFVFTSGWVQLTYINEYNHEGMSHPLSKLRCQLTALFHGFFASHMLIWVAAQHSHLPDPLGSDPAKAP